MKRWSVIVLMTLGALGTSPARAQFAVIDVNAIVQMVQQLRVLQDQLLTARNQLSQAEQQFQSLTGPAWHGAAALGHGPQLSSDRLDRARCGAARRADRVRPARRAA